VSGDESLAAQSRADEAIPLLERIVADNPRLMAAYDLLARCQQERGDTAEARKTLEDAVAIGVPDPIKGTAVVCLCVARPDTDRDTAVKVLTTAVTAGLGGAFKPAEVVFVPDLPRTRNMKLMRRVVRSAWLGEDAGDLSTLVNPEAVQAIRAARP